MPIPRPSHAAAVAAAATHGASVPVAPVTWLFLAAGSLGLLSVVVPHDPATDVAGILAVSCTALALAAVVQPFRMRIGPRLLSALLAAGTLLTTAAIFFTDGVPNASATLYTWICLYAFYALRRPVALAHMALIAAVYAGVIAVNPPAFPVIAHWTTTIGTLLGAGLLVGALRDRLDAVIGRLADAARTDPLTGLMNRRAFVELLDGELARAERTDRPFALVAADIDRFKQINDRLGHVAGDEILIAFADVMTAETRRADVAARLGGEEFGMLLPDTSAEEAEALVDRFRELVTERVSRDGLPVTVSFGVAAWPDDGDSHDALMRNADVALYAAKRAGRDRVMRYEAGRMSMV